MAHGYGHQPARAYRPIVGDSANVNTTGTKPLHCLHYLYYHTLSAPFICHARGVSQVLITMFQFAVTFPSAAITDCKLLFSNFRHLLIRLAYAMIQSQTKTRVRSNHIRLLSTCEILHPKIISNAPRRKNSRGSISLRTCVVRTYNRWR